MAKCDECGKKTAATCDECNRAKLRIEHSDGTISFKTSWGWVRFKPNKRARKQ